MTTKGMTETTAATSSRHLMTYSRASAFRTCPYREYLRYEVGLRPISDAAPLRFGSLWHDLMERVYLFQRWLDQKGLEVHGGSDAFEILSGTLWPKLWPAVSAQETPFIDPGDPINTWVAKQKAVSVEVYSDFLGGNEQRPCYDPEKIEEMAVLARSMLERYLKHWWDLDRTRWEVLWVEPEIRTALLTRLGNPSTKWDIGGKLDAVVRDRSTGKILVIEHKSTAGDPAVLFESLRVDPQVVGYGWMLVQAGICKEDELGGAMYRVSRKKLPAVPKRNQCPGKKADGVTTYKDPITSKRVKDHSSCALCGGSNLGPCSEAAIDTTPEVYAAALTKAQENGFEPTPKHLERLDELRRRGPEVWLDEKHRSIQPHDLDRWAVEMYATSLAKNAAQLAGEGGHWRAGDAAICRRFGRGCDYTDICERFEADSLEAWKEDIMLQQLYELRRPHEELDRVAGSDVQTSADKEQLPIF